MPVPDPTAIGGYAYVYTNVGLDDLYTTYTAAYVYTNVAGGQAAPVVYGVKQASAYVNQQVDIVMTGGGQSPNRYIAIVQTQAPDGTWESVPINQWTDVAASANAYTAARRIEADMSVVDAAHQVVRITVPDWASPPHLPVRVVTHPGVDFTDGFHYGGAYIYTNVVT